jgi:hypothetical protein
MEKPKSLQEIYNANKLENNELFQVIQQHLQLMHPTKRMTVTKVLQILVADSVSSGELKNVESYIVEIPR